MSLQKKLYYINNTSKGWKIMFELYDWIRWSNEKGEATYADYLEFMRICREELNRLGIGPEEVPRKTNDKNFLSRWFYLRGKFNTIEKVKDLNYCDSYNINSFRGKINVRTKYITH